MLLGSLIFILIVSLALYIAWYKSPSQKGKRGEKYVSTILSNLTEEYIILNDVVFPTERGSTQIDHLVVSKFGIFAIETKNYAGKIYGDDDRKEWTQIIVTNVTYAKKWWKTYTYVTKNRFYNPVKQAYSHVYKIKEMLKEYPHLPIIPVVVFTGGADINEVDSRNHVIYIEELIPLISAYKAIYLNDNNFKIVYEILLQNNIRQIVNNAQHIKNLKQAEQKVMKTIQSGICPRCGGDLIKREGRFGSLYGCSNYPECKYTIK